MRETATEPKRIRRWYPYSLASMFVVVAVGCGSDGPSPPGNTGIPGTQPPAAKNEQQPVCKEADQRVLRTEAAETIKQLKDTDLEARTFATDFLEHINTEEWAQEWRQALIADAYCVEQRKGQPWDLKLRPVWYAQVERKGNSLGYLMWESSSPHRLLEFGIEAEQPFVSNGKTCQGIEGVPNLQQFPVKGQTTGGIASGCVPTSAANVLAYWVEHGLAEWRGEVVAGQRANSVLEMLTERLRNAMPVIEIKDAVGYTETGMPLTAASPADLAEAIVEDAKKHGVQVEVSLETFSRNVWEREIKAQRPIILACAVRLPHKPHLSWGHMVTGIGWTVINGDFFVIVHDNFYPTKKANAARWLRAEGLGPVITIAPKNTAASGR